MRHHVAHLFDQCTFDSAFCRAVIPRRKARFQERLGSQPTRYNHQSRAVNLIAHLDGSLRTNAYLEFGREVKTESKIVSSHSGKLVFHRPVPATFFEANSSPMGKRLSETLVACMLCDDDVCFGIALPTLDQRMGFVANHKGHGFIGRVLLYTVN